MTIPVLKTIGNLSTDVRDAAIPVSNVQMLDTSDIPESKRELSLNDIFSILWRRKWTILLSALAAMAIALLFTLSAKPTYRANATIQIERKGPEVVSFGKTESFGGEVDTLNDPFFRTRYETLKSRTLLAKVVADTNLRASLTGENDKPSPIKEFLGLSEKKPVSRAPVDLPALLLQRLLVQPIDKTHLVEIYYEGGSPQEAKDVI
ncbi:MAG: hypothetical protein KAH00_06870, partial [Cocleimonas sp.]|nr:hypothetical protein [Cocleimonas sp.]